MKAMAWIIVLIVIIVAGGAYYYSQDSSSEQAYDNEETTPGSQLKGNSNLAPASEQDTAVPAPTEEPIGQDFPAAATPVESATLAAIAPYTGSGSATRSFDGATFSHTVTANVSDPAPGKFYEGWLVMKTAAGPNFFSTGKMVKNGSQYTLSYAAPQNYPDHVDVVITEETEALGLDNNPEDHVLEGTF